MLMAFPCLPSVASGSAERKARAPARFQFQPHAPAEMLDDLAADRKAEAGALRLRGQRHRRPGGTSRRSPPARPAATPGPLSRTSTTQTVRASLRSTTSTRPPCRSDELRGVGQQVQHDLHQPVGVGADRRHARRASDSSTAAPRLRNSSDGGRARRSRPAPAGRRRSLCHSACPTRSWPGRAPG